PAMAPAEAPATRLTRYPRSSSTSSAPASAMPLTPPPSRTRSTGPPCPGRSDRGGGAAIMGTRVGAVGDVPAHRGRSRGNVPRGEAPARHRPAAGGVDRRDVPRDPREDVLVIRTPLRARGVRASVRLIRIVLLVRGELRLELGPNRGVGGIV